jgi:chemotaxis protein methyltransferase CheR
MVAQDPTDLELRLLLQGVYEHYGYDFRGYSWESLKRQTHLRMQAENVRTLSGLQERVLHDPACMQRLLATLSIPVTEMFRDPTFYAAFRRDVVPHLRTYPFLRVWVAGCASGEEAYSLAILLYEEGLYARSRIYATDMNEALLDQARRGIYPLATMQTNTANYLRAGGSGILSSHYVANYDHAILRPALRRRIVFAHHNLVTDASFNEFNVIWCRNVLIYFDAALQSRVHALLDSSLQRFGFLGLGDKETLALSSLADRYVSVDRREKLYRKVA